MYRICMPIACACVACACACAYAWRVRVHAHRMRIACAWHVHRMCTAHGSRRGSMRRTGARVMLEIRSATLCVSSDLAQALSEHQHWELVRTGESWSPARLRSKCSWQPVMKAATSSSVRKLSSVTTQGDGWRVLLAFAMALPGSLSSCGLYLCPHPARCSPAVATPFGQSGTYPLKTERPGLDLRMAIRLYGYTARQAPGQWATHTGRPAHCGKSRRIRL